MTPERFRALALALPETVEGAHQQHPDFRVAGKIFATLAPDGTWGMVKLPYAEQEARVAAAPGVYAPFAGAWGRQGATRVTLSRARVPDLRTALAAAWRRVAPPAVRKRHPEV
jgi:hypothetical protein